MHGPEHWLGLVRAWIVLGAVGYGLWTLCDAARVGIVRAVGRLARS